MGKMKEESQMQMEAGTLYRLDIDGSVSACVDKISISNGLAWTGDHKTMYYIDTVPRKVFAFDYNIDSGEISKYSAIHIIIFG